MPPKLHPATRRAAATQSSAPPQSSTSAQSAAPPQPPAPCQSAAPTQATRAPSAQPAVVTPARPVRPPGKRKLAAQASASLILTEDALAHNVSPDRVVCRVCAVSITATENCTLLGNWAKHRKACEGERVGAGGGGRAYAPLEGPPKEDIKVKVEEVKPEIPIPGPSAPLQATPSNSISPLKVKKEEETGTLLTSSERKFKGKKRRRSEVEEEDKAYEGDAEKEGKLGEVTDAESEDETWPAPRSSPPGTGWQYDNNDGGEESVATEPDEGDEPRGAN